VTRRCCCRWTWASGCPRTIWHSWCWTRWPRWIWASSAAVHSSRRRCDLARLAADAADSLAGRFEAAGITLERRLTAAGIIADPRWPAAGHAGCLGPACAPRGARCPGDAISAAGCPELLDNWQARSLLMAPGKRAPLAQIIRVGLHIITMAPSPGWHACRVHW